MRPWALALLITAACAVPELPEMPAFRYGIVIDGQSNVPGRKGWEQITDATRRALLSQTYPAVWLYDWEGQFTDPIQVMYDTLGPLAPRPFVFPPTANMGIDLSLMRAVDAAIGQYVGVDVMKFAIGGTSLATERGPFAHYPTLPAGTPNFFNQLVTRAIRFEQLRNCRIMLRIKIEGESDAETLQLANAYEQNARDDIAEWRRYFPYCATVYTALSSGAVEPFHTVVRAAQEKIAKDTPGVFIVNTDALALDSGLHYTADADDLLGQLTAPYAIQGMGVQRSPLADFTVQKSGLTVAFTDLTVDQNAVSTLIAWAWDFGDGTTSSQQTPSHVYAADGAYTVTLTVTNSFYQTATSTQVITVATPTWTVDATNGKGWGSSTAEWTAINTKHQLTAMGVAAPPPDDIFNFQENSGVIVNQARAKNLAITGSPTYRKTIAGIARKAVGANGTATSQNANGSTFENINASSALALAWCQWNSSAADRAQLCVGASTIDEFQSHGGTTFMRKRTAGAQKNGTIAMAGTGPRIVAMLFDNEDQLDDLYSEFERLSLGWTAQSGTSVIATFNTTADAAASTDWFGLAIWRGAGARRTPTEIKRLLQALAYAVSGY